MTTYTIQKGDTLGALAQKYDTSVSEIAKANNISNVNLVKVGQKINIGGDPAPEKVSAYDTEQYRVALSNLQGSSKISSPTYSFKNLNYDGIHNQNLGATTPPPQTQTPPPQESGGSYSVVSGDTLSSIAQRNNTTVQQLLAQNPDITNPNLITVGQKVNLGGSPAPTEQSNIQTETQTQTPPVQSPEDVRLGQNTDLARRAGEAGLSVTEYQNLLSSQNGISQEESDRIAEELGITELEGRLFAKPTKTTQEIFDTAYSTSGLADLKTNIETINTEIEKIRAELLEATGEIDENPFLTESSRVGRGNRILKQAEGKINNKLAQARTLQDLYDGSIDEITNMIERNKEDFGVNQQIDQAKLNYLVAKAEQQAKQTVQSRTTNAKATDEYLKARSSSKAPDLVGSASTGYFKWDATTKSFVQVIAPKVEGSDGVGGTDDTFKPTSNQKALVGRFLNTPEGKALYPEQKLTKEDLAIINSEPLLFYAILQKANEHGIY